MDKKKPVKRKKKHKAAKPLFPMYGSKQRMLPRLLSFVNRAKHDSYVEVFGGTGALLLAKPKSRIEVYNDLNSGFVDLFRVVRNEKKYKKFQRKIDLMPYAKEEWEDAKHGWEKLPRGSVNRAVAFFTLMSLSFRGNMRSYSFGRSISGTGPDRALTHNQAAQRVEILHNRIRHVVIEHESFEKLIPRYDRKNTLFYCDPPYLSETRAGGATSYAVEMDNKMHVVLVKILNKCKGKVILSGYAGKEYEKLKGFTRYDFEHTASVASKCKALGGKRVESVWINF